MTEVMVICRVRSHFSPTRDCIIINSVDCYLPQDRFCKQLRGHSVKLCNIKLKADTVSDAGCTVLPPEIIESQYSNPKSFVNFLLPPLTKGRVGVGSKIYDSFRIAIVCNETASSNRKSDRFLLFKCRLLPNIKYIPTGCPRKSTLYRDLRDRALPYYPPSRGKTPGFTAP